MRSFAWRLLLGSWVGALLCFGAVVAPALFRSLPRSDAGAVVRRVIPALDAYGMIAAGALLALSVGEPKEKRTLVRRGLWAGMGLCAAISFFLVTPAMETVNREEESGRQRFGQLHGVSTALMAAVLAMGVGGLAMPPRR